MRLDQGRESYVSAGRLPSELIFCLLARSHCDVGGVEKTVFQWLAWPCDLFFLLAAPNCDLGEVEKEMIQLIDRPCDQIFCLLAGTECVLSEVEEAVFQWLD